MYIFICEYVHPHYLDTTKKHLKFLFPQNCMDAWHQLRNEITQGTVLNYLRWIKVKHCESDAPSSARDLVTQP